MIGTTLLIGAHLLTQHYGDTRGLESVTPGIYLRLNNGATVGAYSNSYGKGSVYAGWTFSTPDERFALTVGAVTGYPAKRVTALAAPSVRFDIGGGFAARVAYLPKPPGFGQASGLHLAVERGW